MWRRTLFVSTRVKAIGGRPFAALRALQIQRSPGLSKSGAGEGNRTLVVSLEGFCSTIELHPLARLRPCRRSGGGVNLRRLTGDKSFAYPRT